MRITNAIFNRKRLLSPDVASAPDDRAIILLGFIMTGNRFNATFQLSPFSLTPLQVRSPPQLTKMAADLLARV